MQTWREVGIADGTAKASTQHASISSLKKEQRVYEKEKVLNRELYFLGQS